MKKDLTLVVLVLLLAGCASPSKKGNVSQYRSSYGEEAYAEDEQIYDTPDLPKKGETKVATVVTDKKEEGEAKVETATVQKTYMVSKGDTLWRIAKNHGVDVNELKKVNGLSANTIKVGQVLVIP